MYETKAARTETHCKTTVGTVTYFESSSIEDASALSTACFLPATDLLEANQRIAELTQQVLELNDTIRVTKQAREAARQGLFRNPYADTTNKKLSLLWDTENRAERECLVYKDRLGRVSEIMIAAFSLKLSIETPTDKQHKAIKLFELAFAKFKEACCK